jgi:hypothetical protein
MLSTGPWPSGMLIIKDCTYMPQQMRQSQEQQGHPAGLSHKSSFEISI